MRLSPRQLDGLAGAVCGDRESGPFTYRSMAQLQAFRGFTAANVEFEEGGSRFYDTLAWLQACNATDEGQSGLPVAIDRVVVAVLDRREFKRARDRTAAVDVIDQIFEAMPITIDVDALDGTVEIIGETSSRGQQIIDEKIRTVYEQVLTDSDLEAARAHYRKAERYLNGPRPDYANAAKEAVCSVESLARKLTGARDLGRAMDRVKGRELPAPLAAMVTKLYAYRGAESGVAHGHEDLPDVDRDDAQFVVNLAAVVGVYLTSKLVVDE